MLIELPSLLGTRSSKNIEGEILELGSLKTSDGALEHPVAFAGLGIISDE